MLALAPFHDCAHRIGLDPAAVFAEAAARGPATIANAVQTFGARADITPSAFAFAVRDTPDGPEYATADPLNHAAPTRGIRRSHVGNSRVR